jgi:phosphatidate cytidylyltransferase
LLYAGCWLGAVYFGITVFTVFIAVTVIIMALEFRGMMSNREFDVGIIFLPLCAAAYPVLIWINHGVILSFPYGLDRTERVFALGVGIVILYFARAILRVDKENAFEEAVMGIAGSAYLGLTVAHLMLLRIREGGTGFILMLLGALWMTDTLAYIIGILFGRHRLAPAISPKKSVEGALAGLAGGVIGSVLVWYTMMRYCPTLVGTCLSGTTLWGPVLIGVGVSIVGQVGDLAESLMKRWGKVKDSGTLIPGHGGILDRMDSVLFAGPFMYYCIRFLDSNIVVL